MFKKFSLLLLVGTYAALQFPACTYENTDDVTGPVTCDTLTMSYANDIVPILQSQCYSCHDAVNVSTSGYQFDSYAFLLDYVNAGSLVERINDPVSPMPTTGLMDECSIAKIEAWVNQGALDN